MPEVIFCHAKNNSHEKYLRIIMAKNAWFHSDYIGPKWRDNGQKNQRDGSSVSVLNLD